MRRRFTYSTKCLDKQLKYERSKWEKEQQGIFEDDYMEIVLQRLKEQIARKEYDWIINELSNLHTCYSKKADNYMRIDADAQKSKEYHYLAALASELCYAMIAKGFSHYCYDSGCPYNFKKKNFIFSHNAILANEPELALRVTGDDTLEGALILQDYERACGMLPQTPDDGSAHTDELWQCMWAIAHRDEKAFNQYMEQEIRSLRSQERYEPVTLDSLGLTVIKLANQCGMSCNLHVIELPQQLLDDVRIDTSGLFLPMADEIRTIINTKI